MYSVAQLALTATRMHVLLCYYRPKIVRPTHDIVRSTDDLVRPSDNIIRPTHNIVRASQLLSRQQDNNMNSSGWFIGANYLATVIPLL